MEAHLISFQFLKELHEEDEDFCPYLKHRENIPKAPCIVQDELLFKGNPLCIPKGPICKLLVKKVHDGGLASHFSINKIIGILKENFYWPNIGGDVHKIISKCITYHQVKSQFHQDLYYPTQYLKDIEKMQV